MLQEGSRGDVVRDLQAKLAGAGYDLAQDGIFGRDTALALRIFQAANDLSIDGIAGPVTMAALQAQRQRTAVSQGFWPWFANY